MIIVRHEVRWFNTVYVLVLDRHKNALSGGGDRTRRGPQSSAGFQRWGVMSRAVLSVPDGGHHSRAGLPRGCRARQRNARRKLLYL